MERLSAPRRCFAAFLAFMLAVTLGVPTVAWADDPNPNDGAPTAGADGTGSTDANNDATASGSGSQQPSSPGAAGALDDSDDGDGADSDAGATSSSTTPAKAAAKVPAKAAPRATMVATVTSGGSSADYATMSEAYAAAQDGAIITLTSDVIWDDEAGASSITIKKSITLDLCGHKLDLFDSKAGKNGKGVYLDVTAGTLTIKDSSPWETGVMASTSEYYVVRGQGGSIVLESGTLTTDSSVRTVYLHSSKSSFTMTGGTVGNATPAAGSNNNVIEASSCAKVTISGGTIISTGSLYPHPCLKMSSGTYEISGGYFSTTADTVLWHSGKGAVTLSGGTFKQNAAAATLRATDTPRALTIGSTDASAVPFNVPSLALGSKTVVAVCDNVTVGKVMASSAAVTCLSDASQYGGLYENDFSSLISPVGLMCVKQPDGLYKVVKVEQPTDATVAEVVSADGSKWYSSDLAGVMAKLKRGDTVTLLKDVTSQTTSSYTAAVSDFTLDLNGHSISSNALYGLSIKAASGVQEGDAVVIKGSGTIAGKQAGVSCEGPASGLVTLEMESGVQCAASADAADYLADVKLAKGARMAVGGLSATPAIKAESNGVEYWYGSLQSAINDQTGGVVEVLSDVKETSKVLCTNADPVIVKLNGNTLTLTSVIGLAANGADLAIEGGTINYAYASTSFGYALGMESTGQDGSTLSLKDVELNSAAKNGTAVTINGSLEGSKLSLEGCTISCTGTGSTVGVYFPVKNGELTIVDTAITAMNAVQVKGGTATISETAAGKTSITSTGPAAAPSSEPSGCTNTGDGIYVEDTYGFNPVVYVKSGSVSSANSDALSYFDNGLDNATGTIEVSGGSFSSEVKPEFCAAGYEPTVKNADGTYSVKPITRTLVFDVQGVGTAPESQEVAVGGLFTEPSLMVPGYRFGGWFADEDCTVPFDFTVAVTEDMADPMTAYAKWTQIPIAYHTVTFVDPVADDAVVELFQVVDGQTVAEPAAPQHEGYTFLGWFTYDFETEQWGEAAYDFSQPVTDSFTLYAKMVPQDDSVGNGGVSGDKPAAPSKDVTTSGAKTGDLHSLATSGAAAAALLAAAGLLLALRRMRSSR